MKLEIELPEELAPFKTDLEFFILMMVKKLQMNRHKGYGDATYSELWGGLEGEMNEVSSCFKGEGHQFDLVLESADVANFAFLIALKAMSSTKEDHKRAMEGVSQRQRAPGGRTSTRTTQI